MPVDNFSLLVILFNGISTLVDYLMSNLVFCVYNLLTNCSLINIFVIK